jgi:hypothetical protein
MLVVVAGSVVALSAFAVDRSKIEKSIELKDEVAVYLFKHGMLSLLVRAPRSCASVLQRSRRCDDDPSISAL